MGDKDINSSIGSQWRYRIDKIDEHTPLYNLCQPLH
ncbi:polymorphic toxin type 15 domain-containing protein [Candidatus Merdisoma sp. JLR.KK011]